ncbi:MAG: hypothetical protein K2J25_06540, partial [Oscillospiraceae bacterium]|nr:hypothetical protein [Oscillospiraceae bacterium]
MELSNFEISKIVSYATKCHTGELVDKLVNCRHDDPHDRSDRAEIVALATAIAIRNGVRTVSVKSPFRAIYSNTNHLVDKVQEKWYSSMNEQERKKKIAHYCAGIAIRNGVHDY